jgi:hypothetical protein
MVESSCEEHFKIMKPRTKSMLWMSLAGFCLSGCPIPDAQKEVTSSSTGGDVSSSSSSSSSGNGGAGGNGGAVASSSSSGGMGGNGGAAGMGGAAGAGGMGPVCLKQPGEAGSCGTVECPAACPKLVMVGTGAVNGLGATFVSGNGGGWTTPTSILGMKSDYPPAFAIRPGKGDGVAVFRNSTPVTQRNLAVSIWNESGFLPVQDVMAGVAQLDFSPVVVANAEAVHIAYRNIASSNNEYRYAAFNGMDVNPKVEVVKDNIPMSMTTSLGYCSPALAIVDTKLLIINPGEKSNGNDDEALYGRYRTFDPMGSWDAGFPFMTIPASLDVDDVTPAIVPLSTGPELLVVFTEKITTKPLYFMTRNAGTWSAPVQIPNTSSIEVVLLPLASGEAILVYREYNSNTTTPTKVFGSRFNGMQWSAVTEIPGSKLAKSKPVLALGAGDAEAELLFIDSTGDVQHARLRKGELDFDPPMPIDGASGLVGIAAATNL